MLAVVGEDFTACVNRAGACQPPRPVWRRVFDVSLQAAQIQLEWYRGIASPGGTLCAVMGDFARTDPPLSASLLLPGAQGGQFVTAGAVVLQVTAQAPNVAAGLQTLPLGIPNDPSYLGLEVHLQSLVFDLQTNVLTLAEPATVHLVN